MIKRLIHQEHTRNFMPLIPELENIWHNNQIDLHREMDKSTMIELPGSVSQWLMEQAGRRWALAPSADSTWSMFIELSTQQHAFSNACETVTKIDIFQCHRYSDKSGIKLETNKNIWKIRYWESKNHAAV